jgi:hypothetical protein
MFDRMHDGGRPYYGSTWQRNSLSDPTSMNDVLTNMWCFTDWGTKLVRRVCHVDDEGYVLDTYSSIVVKTMKSLWMTLLWEGGDALTTKQYDEQVSMMP